MEDLGFFYVTWQAARYNDLEDVERLTSAGVCLDSKDSEGRTGNNSFVFIINPTHLIWDF